MLKPPGPRGLELFSVLNDWRKSGLAAFERLAQRHGDIVYAKFPGRRAYLLNHPDYIRHVLMDNRGNYLKLNNNKNAQRYFGSSMQISNGDDALRLRRALNPAFQHLRVTRGYCPPVVEATRAAADRWTSGPRPALTQDLAELALTAHVQIHFGTRPGAETDELAALFRNANGPLSGFLPPGWIPVRANRKYHAAIDVLNRDVYARIQMRRASGAIGPDLLSCFVSLAGDGLTDLEIRNELLSMMATYTTIAIALNQTMRQVASLPAVDDMLHDEATQALEGRPGAYQDLANLPYSEQVVKEALRAAPPAGLRRARRRARKRNRWMEICARIARIHLALGDAPRPALVRRTASL